MGVEVWVGVGVGRGGGVIGDWLMHQLAVSSLLRDVEYVNGVGSFRDSHTVEAVTRGETVSCAGWCP